MTFTETAGGATLLLKDAGPLTLKGILLTYMQRIGFSIKIIDSPDVIIQGGTVAHNSAVPGTPLISLVNSGLLIINGTFAENSAGQLGYSWISQGCVESIWARVGRLGLGWL